MKLTYALLRKQRTNNLRYIVRTLLMKLTPGLDLKQSPNHHTYLPGRFQTGDFLFNVGIKIRIILIWTI